MPGSEAESKLFWCIVGWRCREETPIFTSRVMRDGTQGALGFLIALKEMIILGHIAQILEATGNNMEKRYLC